MLIFMYGETYLWTAKEELHLYVALCGTPLRQSFSFLFNCMFYQLL